MARVVAQLSIPIATTARVDALESIMRQIQKRFEEFAQGMNDISPFSLTEIDVWFEAKE